jgi:hypothetical protein
MIETNRQWFGRIMYDQLRRHTMNESGNFGMRDKAALAAGLRMSAVALPGRARPNALLAGLLLLIRP